jgi:hypothetical protein
MVSHVLALLQVLSPAAKVLSVADDAGVAPPGEGELMLRRTRRKCAQCDCIVDDQMPQGSAGIARWVEDQLWATDGPTSFGLCRTCCHLRIARELGKRRLAVCHGCGGDLGTVTFDDNGSSPQMHQQYWTVANLGNSLWHAECWAAEVTEEGRALRAQWKPSFAKEQLAKSKAMRDEKAAEARRAKQELREAERRVPGLGCNYDRWLDSGLRGAKLRNACGGGFFRFHSDTKGPLWAAYEIARTLGLRLTQLCSHCAHIELRKHLERQQLSRCWICGGSMTVSFGEDGLTDDLWTGSAWADRQWFAHRGCRGKPSKSVTGIASSVASGEQSARKQASGRSEASPDMFTELVDRAIAELDAMSVSEWEAALLSPGEVDVLIQKFRAAALRAHSAYEAMDTDGRARAHHESFMRLADRVRRGCIKPNPF